MTNRVRRKYNTLLSVKGYMDTHPLVPPIAEVTAQMTIVTGSIASIESLGGTQAHGEGEALGATDSRELIAVDLRAAMREISGIAKHLDQTLYPGAKATFRLTGTGNYTALINRARGFLTAIGPIKAAFVDRGMPADFDEQLAGKADEFESATNRKWDGRQTQKSGTAGLETLWRRGMAALNELDAIVTNLLRTSNPTLLAVWKAAKRQERMPQREPATPTRTLALASAAIKGAPAGFGAGSKGELSQPEEAAMAIEPRLNGSSANVVA